MKSEIKKLKKIMLKLKTSNEYNNIDEVDKDIILALEIVEKLETWVKVLDQECGKTKVIL